MTPANFMLLTANDGLEVAGLLSVDQAHKVVTFNANENLDSSTSYLMVCTQGVRDIYGQSLVVNSVGNFTTAA